MREAELTFDWKCFHFQFLSCAIVAIIKFISAIVVKTANKRERSGFDFYRPFNYYKI